MKKTITTIFLLAISILTKAQTAVSDFENLSLPGAETYYNDVNSADFQSGNAIFEYDWNTAFGGYWNYGFAYSNITDSSTSGFMNQYAVKAAKGYNSSSNYVVAYVSQAPKIFLTGASVGKTVPGFYVCNSTYAHNSMRDGDAFSRKFGDTTGTNSGLAQGTYPDYFKLVVRKYYGGVLTNDSVVVYLADYRFTNSAQDYILKNWYYVNTSSLGNVDSLEFHLRSSDNSAFGMNTPAYFCMDNFTASVPVGINEIDKQQLVSVYPNPANDVISIEYKSEKTEKINLECYDLLGNLIYAEKELALSGKNRYDRDINFLPNGNYIVRITGETGNFISKFSKQ